MVSAIGPESCPSWAGTRTCALAGGSDLFVTGDRALLDLGDVRGLPIVSPRDAWARLFAAA
jgi:hypothetical protein